MMSENEEVVYETIYEVCKDCDCDTFKIEVTGAGEIASYTDWYCSMCGEHIGGFLNDPLDEVETHSLSEKAKEEVD